MRCIRADIQIRNSRILPSSGYDKYVCAWGEVFVMIDIKPGIVSYFVFRAYVHHNSTISLPSMHEHTRNSEEVWVFAHFSMSINSRGVTRWGHASTPTIMSCFDRRCTCISHYDNAHVYYFSNPINTGYPCVFPRC